MRAHFPFSCNLSRGLVFGAQWNRSPVAKKNNKYNYSNATTPIRIHRPYLDPKCINNWFYYLRIKYWFSHGKARITSKAHNFLIPSSLVAIVTTNCYNWECNWLSINRDGDREKEWEQSRMLCVSLSVLTHTCVHLAIGSASVWSKERERERERVRAPKNVKSFVKSTGYYCFLRTFTRGMHMCVRAHSYLKCPHCEWPGLDTVLLYEDWAFFSCFNCYLSFLLLSYWFFLNAN